MKFNKEQFKKFIVSEASKYMTNMNTMDSEGGDGDIATAVSFDASSSEHNGASTKGMKKASFKSKTDGPKTKTSQPFTDDSFKSKMNKMDAEDKSIPKNGAKTYVDAGSKTKTGQHKSVFSTNAKNEKEKAKSIASAIQLPESFKNEKELQDFIMENAKRISKLI